MEKELQDIELCNWVKACIALKYLKEGIFPFMSEQCKDLYIQNISNVKVTCNTQAYRCTQCNIDRIKPSHAQVKKCNKRKCNCKVTNTVLCKENGSCSELYDLIKDLHVNNEPNFANTKCSLWSDKDRGPWEQMKCFIFTPGYEDVENVSGADVTALIQICGNNKTLNNIFGTHFCQLDQLLSSMPSVDQHDLCLSQHIESLSTHLWTNNDVSPDSGYMGLSLLHLAAALGFTQCIQALVCWRNESSNWMLEYEVDANSADLNSCTPLVGH